MDVEAVLGALGVGLLALVVVPIADTLLPLALLALSAALAVGLTAATDAGVAATPFEVVGWACAGALFARVFDERALALAVPLLVGVLDVVALGAVLGDVGSAAPAPGDVPGGGDPVTLALPGTDLSSPLVEVTVVVFLAASAVWSRRLAPSGSRTWSVGAPLVLALVPAVVVALASATDRAVPGLALLALVALAIQGAQLVAERRRP